MNYCDQIGTHQIMLEGVEDQSLENSASDALAVFCRCRHGGMTSNRCIGPWPASWPRDTFDIEFARNGSRRPTSGERLENAAHHRRLGLIDHPLAANWFAARVKLTDNIVAVTHAAAGAALAYAPF